MNNNNKFATVHDIPDELISYIFIIGLDDGNVNIRYLRTISSVCSFWRNVAISTANLWSSILYEPYTFPLDPRFPNLVESIASRICERVGTFLARSKSASIDLDITIRDHSEKEIRRIADIVTPHLWRCRSLTIRHNRQAVYRTFFPLPGHLERLEKLELLVAESDILVSAVTLFTKHAAPPLRRLCLKPAMGLYYSMDFIPTNTLTHLDIGIDPAYADQAIIMQFLRRCAALEELRVLKWKFHELPTDNVDPVSLPFLKSLHVKGTLSLAFTMYLRTPNIVELCLYSRHVRQPEFPVVRPTMLQMETVIWDRQSLHDLRCHHLVPFSSIKNLILRNCGAVLFLVRHLAGSLDESGQAPIDPLRAIESPAESQGHHLFPRLEYLEIIARPPVERGVPISWFKALLDNRTSLRVAVHPFEPEDPEAVEAQLGPRFAAIP